MEAFVFVFVAILLCGCVAAKECTNIPTQSHTFRYELLMSKNATWKAEVMDHYHLTPTDETVWADLLPRTPGTPYGGWEGPEVELRGHFVG